MEYDAASMICQAPPRAVREQGAGVHPAARARQTLLATSCSSL